jgi:hypothetical protein
MLAAITKGGGAIGVVYDNLAAVRRLQKRWPEAEQVSDRAIAALQTMETAQISASWSVPPHFVALAPTLKA